MEDTTYLLHLSRYIHLNPVKADLTSRAENWQYSSYREHIGLKNPDLADPSIILDMLTKKYLPSIKNQQKDYKEFVEDWDFEYMSFKMKKLNNKRD